MKKREKLDFHDAEPSMRELYWHADVTGPRRTLTPVLAWALEAAYMTGALQALGMAMGWPEDDCRVRALQLQQQAAVRLGELQESKGSIDEFPYSNADQRVKARARARQPGKTKRWKPEQ